jgi:hypothetical protein
MSAFFKNIEYARNYFFNTLENLQKKSIKKMEKKHTIEENDIIDENNNISNKSIDNEVITENTMEPVEPGPLDEPEPPLENENNEESTRNKSYERSIPYISSDDEYVSDSDDGLIYDKSPYIYKNLYSSNEQYFHYINDRLNKEFGGCMDTDSTKYKIHFCIYAMNGTCSFRGDIMPFLQFIFENNGGVYSFPTVEFNCSPNVDADVYFKNECIKKLLDLFPIKQIDEDILEDIYKGFLEYDESNIFVVFDFSNFFKSMIWESTETTIMSTFLSSMKKETYTYVWGIVDDVNEKSINNIPIGNIILEFFNKYRYMKEIKKEYGSIASVPMIAYLCKFENGSYVNINKSENFKNSYEKRSDHPLLGPFYIFSKDKINENAKRFAVFTENNIVIDDKLESISESDPKFFNRVILNKSVIEYTANNESLLCIKPETFFYEL